MPKPIPPPPPQPSVDETRAAVRFLFKVVAGAAAFFGLVAASYGPDNFFLPYGRSTAPSWNLHKLERTDVDAMRAHPGGKVAWLVGSSILREAFDEDQINATLAERGSEWRVVKLGMSRGAAGLAAGVLDRVPLQDGDLVVHNVTHANFHRDWVTWTGIPEDLMMYTLPASEFWHIQGWTLADKLEHAAAQPTRFWQWHEDIMDGKAKWFRGLLWWGRAPKRSRPRFHTKFRTRRESTDYIESKRRLGPMASIYLTPDCCDFSDEQFNMRGLRRMEARVQPTGATLELIHIPARAEYEGDFVHRDAATAWEAWRASVENLSFAPRPDEGGYYDFKHPNFEGRALLSEWLVGWLESDRPRGTPAALDWPVPGYNQPGVAPPAGAGLAGDDDDPDADAPSPQTPPAEETP